jgi:hypothetical protein
MRRRVSCARQGKVLVDFGIFAVVILAMAATAIAQTTGAATLVGSVTDTTGAVVPAARVTVVNTETSFRSETQTSPEGNYYVPYLSPGIYRITLEAAGFKRYVREGLTVRTGETPRVDITLELGSTTESITVSAESPLLATDTAVAGQILEGQAIADIPTVQKRIVRMLAYFPGAIVSAGQYHISGQRSRAIGYTLDGMNGKTPGTQALGTGEAESIQGSQEALEEMKVTTSGLPAEFGHSAGGVMNLVYKSGTNQLHGSFDGRVINQTLIHRDYFTQSPFTNPFWYRMIDGAISGPLRLPKIYNGKNRTFFLFAYGGHFQKGKAGTSVATVPTEAMYNGDFSFGGQGLPIYNPFTTRQDATGKWLRDPFPGNVIPTSLIDPVVKNFLARNPWNEPTDPGVLTRTGPTLNRNKTVESFSRRQRWDIKIDHQFSPNHKMFGRYSQAHHRSSRAGYEIELAWSALGLNAQPIPTDNINGVFSDTLVFGPNRFNDFRVGYNRRAYSLESLTYGQDWANQLGMPNVSPATFPIFNIGYGLSSSLGRAREVGEDISFQDSFTQIIGRHTIKTGYELLRTRYNSALESLPSGSYTFGGAELPFTPNTGQTFASFLLGTVSSAVYTQDFATWLPRWWSHSWYVQDEWKPIRGLTLNMGLRWSYESPFQTKYGQQSQFDPTVVDPLTGKLGAITHPKGLLGKRDLNNFQPRLGLAWNFRPKLVFRSSFGLMTQDLNVNAINQNFGEYLGTANVQQPTGDPQHIFRLSQGPPPIRYAVQPDGSIPFVGANTSARAAERYDPNMRNPYVLSWSAGIQYEFSHNWLVETIYQGTAGVGLLNNWDINAIPLNVSTDPAVLNQIFQAAQNYKPYPQFGSVKLYSNFGHSTYHAGTLRVERRFTAGLTLLGFYTYAKTLDESDDDGTVNGITYYNRRLEKGRAGYDIRHHFMSILNYELPLGRGRRWMNRGGIVNQALGGWNFIWTETLESGLPTTITFAGSPFRYLPGNSRPNALVPIEQAVAPNWTIGANRFPTSAQNPYLRLDAFAYPAAFTAGTLGRNMFEAPGMNWMQFALGKNWVLGDRTRFSLRVDFNNLPFKQPQFAQPNSVYNTNAALTFGRFTSVRGGTSGAGTSTPHIVVGGRVQF